MILPDTWSQSNIKVILGSKNFTVNFEPEDYQLFVKHRTILTLHVQLFCSKIRESIYQRFFKIDDIVQSK